MSPFVVLVPVNDGEIKPRPLPGSSFREAASVDDWPTSLIQVAM
jgi:hypothetical protein